MSDKTYTREEVAKHNAEGSCWLIINNKVYDVTKFLDDHPGGEEVLLDCGGKEATEDFDDVGHTDEAIEQMEEFLIGSVEGAPAPAAAPAKPAANKGGASPPSDDGSSLLSYAIFGILAASAAYFLFFN